MLPPYQRGRSHQAGGPGKPVPSGIDKRRLDMHLPTIACDRKASKKSKNRPRMDLLTA
jgi:hypothetical protein